MPFKILSNKWSLLAAINALDWHTAGAGDLLPNESANLS